MQRPRNSSVDKWEEFLAAGSDEQLREEKAEMDTRAAQLTWELRRRTIVAAKKAGDLSNPPLLLEQADGKS